MIMDFINGGELFYHLRREKKFDENRAKFYARTYPTQHKIL